jgi:hypothetical protein
MVLTVSFVLSPVTNSFCHRHRRIGLVRARSGRLCLRKLDTSNGRQDHTTSPSAKAPFVRAPSDRSQVIPALPSPRAPDAAASTASRPASVTIAIRPSSGARRRRYRSDLVKRGTEKFLQMGLDSPNRVSRRRNPPQKKRGWITLSRLGKNSFPTRLQSVVECGADSRCVVADFLSKTRPAGLQAAGDDYDGIEQ